MRKMDNNYANHSSRKGGDKWGKVNKCISCDVKNCYYHDNSNYCTAEQINVGPVSAVSSAETICATFKPKDE